MKHSKRQAWDLRKWSMAEQVFAGELESVWRETRRSDAGDDDILDALAALWTARRISAGSALTVPATSIEHDRLGQPMVIWA